MSVQKHGLMLRTGSEIISLTREQIAKYISSAREVVSRTLKYIVSERIVEVVLNGVQQIKIDCRTCASIIICVTQSQTAAKNMLICI